MELSTRARTPLSAVAIRYLTHRRAIDRLRPDTIRGYRTTLVAFQGVAGPIEVGAISYRHVARFATAKDSVSDGTMRQHLSRLKTFGTWCRSEHYTRVDFMLGIRPPKKTRSQPRSLTAAEVRAVLAACPTQRERLVVTIMVQLGLRVGEVVRLRRCDIDLDGRTMLVDGKGGHKRTMPVLDSVALELARYLLEAPAAMSDPLIRSHVDRRSKITRGAVSAIVSKIMREAGVKEAAFDGKSAHAFRHSCACDMLAAGAEMRDVQEALGHRHLSTTADIYLNRLAAMGRLREAMEGRSYA